MTSAVKTPARVACFVTGTDTEIGKTFIASALVHWLGQRGWRAIGMKPIAAGSEREGDQWHNEDVDALAAVSTVSVPLPQRTPYLLQTPAAPHVAAALEGVTLTSAVVRQHFEALRAQADAVVVEGVGGFRVPLNDTEDTADLAQALGLPVVLVVGLRLGCINHALLTAEAIRSRGLRLVGWVANSTQEDMAFEAENIAALAARLDVPLLGAVPRLRADEVASGDAATPRSEVFAARARAMAAQAARHFDGTALEAALNLA